MTRTTLIAVAMAAAGTLTAFTSALGATPGTSFTYQGLLEESGAPITTAVDVRFTLYSDAGGASQVGSPQTVSSITPDDGVFSAPLDFGVAAFADNEARWMRVEVSPAGAGTYDDLGIQALEASPFALNTRGITVDSAGNVGIGVAAPEEKLDVEGWVQVDSGIQHDNAASNFLRFLGNNDTHLSGGSFVRLQTGSADRVFINNSAVTVTNDLIANADVGIGTSSPLARLHAYRPGGNNDDPAAVFEVQNCGNPCGQPAFTEAVRLINNNANGRVGIAFSIDGSPDVTSTPNLYIGTREGVNNNSFGVYSNVAGTLTERFYVAGSDGGMRLGDGPHRIGGAVGFSNVMLNLSAENATFDYALNITGADAGKPGGGSWASTSDARLKKNVHGLQGSLDTLLKLRGVNYEYKDPEAIGELDGVRTGFIAQEVEQILPDWVWTAQDGYKRVTIRGFEALAVEAMRELKAENDDLQSRVATLESKLQSAGVPTLRSSLTWPAIGAIALCGLAVARRRKANDA